MLLLFNTLAGGALLLSVFYIDRLGYAAAFTIPTGLLLVYIVLGCLSRDYPLLERALILTAIAFTSTLGCVVMTRIYVRRFEDDIIAHSSPYPGGVVNVDFESETGKHLTTLYAAQTISVTATLAVIGMLILLTHRRRLMGPRPD